VSIALLQQPQHVSTWHSHPEGVLITHTVTKGFTFVFTRLHLFFLEKWGEHPHSKF